MQCWDGKLPGLEDAEQYRGIFITGSHYSAYEDLPWINNLAEWLRSFLQRQHSTRIVAVCFGSQVTESFSPLILLEAKSLPAIFWEAGGGSLVALKHVVMPR